MAGMTILMTEKDAVKCGQFATRDFCYIPANTIVDDAINSTLESLINRLIHGQQTA
jgi:tetraacyldisaccharide-1-P 4'-kinase